MEGGERKTRRDVDRIVVIRWKGFNHLRSENYVYNTKNNGDWESINQLRMIEHMLKGRCGWKN